MKLALILFTFFVGCSGGGKQHFASVSELDPSIKLEIRYVTKRNFVGERIHGYQAPKCYLTKKAAQALVRVQKDLAEQGKSLRVYDCYRPQRAVDHFVAWSKDLSDARMKKEFYPEIDKQHLFRDGYIASKSGHSRGSTVDLTIDGLDMGTPYDFFSPLSHTENFEVGEAALEKRQLLVAAMQKHGFKNYDKEWWHYTLENEPFPDRYFDFEVK